LNHAVEDLGAAEQGLVFFFGGVERGELEENKRAIKFED
jgi:hypothetical protein